MNTTKLRKLIFDTSYGSGILAVIITIAVLAAWFGYSKILLGAYNEKDLTKQFLKEDSKIFKTVVIEVGTDTVARIIAGTSSMTLTGTSSYATQPRIEYNGATGQWSFKNAGGGTETTAFGTITTGYLSLFGNDYVLKNSGSSTDQLLTNPTLAGQGTITATLNANGANISPTELGYLDGTTGNLQTQITTATGSITNHAHTGSDGTTQIAHDSVTGTGTNSHPTIDAFIASKAQASGLASLDANSLVAQNPASGTSTPGANKVIMSDGTNKMNDGWLSDNITKLGTPTTDNISEGSTNKYYTDARVNAAVGSTSVNIHSDVNITMNEGDFVKISGGQLVAGSSSVTVAFSEVTGAPIDNSNFKTEAGTSTVPVRDSSGNLFVSGIIGGTTTGAIKIPSGTTAQRPVSPELGMVRVESSSSGIDASGGSITTWGTYTIHTFTSSGTFSYPGTITTNNIAYYDGQNWTQLGTGTIISSTSTVEYLVVAGGGGGGSNRGAGGGAGGMRTGTVTVTNGTGYTITVGAGGSAHTQGNSSSIGALVTTVGGGRGAEGSEVGGSGGSGGGGGTAGGGQAGGSGTSDEGNNGGSGIDSANPAGGGGGGKGAVGVNATNAQGGNGGAGTVSTISGSSVTYAGGGGGGAQAGAGGTGGTGGGGNGSASGNGSNGTANTGGGGGGASDGNTGGNGGSGIVIIRYPTP